MKKLLLLLVLGISTIFYINSRVKANEKLHEKGGRCTGSAYCSACSNCSGCAYCNSGGSCGVCSGGYSHKNTKKHNLNVYSRTSSTGNNYSLKSSSVSSVKKAKKSSPYSFSSPTKVYYAIEKVVNIHKAPDFSSAIVEKVKKGSRLIQLEQGEEWLKVKVYKTGTKGFVFYKNIR